MASLNRSTCSSGISGRRGSILGVWSEVGARRPNRPPLLLKEVAALVGNERRGGARGIDASWIDGTSWFR